jgi:hypothetical protein
MADVLNEDLHDCMCSRHKNKNSLSLCKCILNPSLRYEESIAHTRNKKVSKQVQFVAKIQKYIVSSVYAASCRSGATFLSKASGSNSGL